MKAATFTPTRNKSGPFLEIRDTARPEPKPGYVLLRVLACGVCRTDLHIVEGMTPSLPQGMRVGVSWMGGVDGDCWYCRHEMENLCDKPTFTGYTVDGGYAEFALVRSDFMFPLPAGLDSVHVAPYCAPGSSASAACE